MWKSGVTALLAAAVISPVLAQSDEFDQGMNTMWEVLWHQSGTPTRLVRWEEDIQVRISGVNLAAHRQHTLQALRDAANEADRGRCGAGKCLFAQRIFHRSAADQQQPGIGNALDQRRHP